MALLVMVICLFAERFWVHARMHQRFDWFIAYANRVALINLPQWVQASSWVRLLCVVLPIWLGVACIFYAVDSWLFGLFGLFDLVLSVFIVYYCLGPMNPFYPLHAVPVESLNEADVGSYLADMNDQLFAVLFWYVFTGPLGVLFYRLISLCCRLPALQQPASLLKALWDWLPARMTALLYLLVGNFQDGLKPYQQQFFSQLCNNRLLLHSCGLAALSLENNSKKTMRYAEQMVEHALIVFLVVAALCTLGAWL